MIQRYPGCVRGKWSPDKYVLFTDHEADKAEAVAEAVEKATKELRAEFIVHADCAVCSRPILGCPTRWIHAGMETSHLARPVEPRSSGGRDED